MSSPPPSFRLSLAWKVTLALGSVVLAAMLAVSALANQAAARELRGFLFRGTPTDSVQLAAALADYYRAQGSWQGVHILLNEPSPLGRMMRAMGLRGGPANNRMMDMMDRTTARIVLSDPEGRVIAGGLPRGQIVPRADLAASTPIQADDRVVGYLIVAEPSQSSLAETLIGRVNRGTWLVAALTGLAALIAGGILVAGLLKPVRELTAASRALAEGDLSRRVPVRSQDEVGELSAAFNQMADKLQRAEQVRRDMTADIAHELRNPLAVLQANVEALADGVYPPTADNFASVLDQTRLLNRLVEDLRTLAMADAGQLQFDPVPTQLLALAQRVVDSHQQGAAEAGVTLRVAGSPIAAAVDPMRVEQILGNLLANAIAHTGKGREVGVHVGSGGSGDQAVVAVTDQGEGIPEGDLERIFERFFRTDRSRTRAEGGTGLGLAIARQLVVLQRGEIHAANRPGGGAEFTVVFPRIQEVSVGSAAA